MVVDDEDAALGFQHPDAAVGNELPEAVPAKESIEVSPTRHVALDEEDVAGAVGPVGLVLLAEVVQPGGHDGVEKTPFWVVHVRRNAKVVGAADVDSGLVRKESGANGCDNPVGDVVRTAGVCLRGSELGALALSHRDAKFVEDVAAVGVGFAGKEIPALGIWP